MNRHIWGERDLFNTNKSLRFEKQKENINPVQGFISIIENSLLNWASKNVERLSMDTVKVSSSKEERISVNFLVN